MPTIRRLGSRIDDTSTGHGTKGCKRMDHEFQVSTANISVFWWCMRMLRLCQPRRAGLNYTMTSEQCSTQSWQVDFCTVQYHACGRPRGVALAAPPQSCRPSFHHWLPCRSLRQIPVFFGSLKGCNILSQGQRSWNSKQWFLIYNITNHRFLKKYTLRPPQCTSIKLCCFQNRCKMQLKFSFTEPSLQDSIMDPQRIDDDLLCPKMSWWCGVYLVYPRIWPLEPENRWFHDLHRNLLFQGVHVQILRRFTSTSLSGV